MSKNPYGDVFLKSTSNALAEEAPTDKAPETYGDASTAVGESPTTLGYQ